ncbi:MAG TPA: FAD-dependent monooxygenase [Ktedonobacteraceae bacterium]|jgi:2-polyprenyl-6-methoxyphenol hydroxylase-like FAD-dependent oxidoreductase
MNDHQEVQDPGAPAVCDVAIVGGGIAGLTLALQLKEMRPAIRLVVIEKQAHPVPEAAHKVGESTVEILAHYLRDVLKLGEHLQKQQLNKFGLRMFFSADDNRDITRRVELGHAVLPPHGVGTYQLDRGRLENALGVEVGRRGVNFLDGCKVQQIELRPEQETHCLQLLQGEEERTLQARWVVDASGRSSFLKRQLGLAKKGNHRANAVWFRINHPIDINTWSSDPAWQQRIHEGERALSTNHLMGAGYWVWLIRLASDSISIGIVSDAQMHPFEEMNRFERALAWLERHEPQCAQVIAAHREQIQDFRVMKDYSYSCEQVYSADRWCLTGESAAALDPLYSSGGDLIAISNGLVCDLIGRSLAGEDVEETAAIHNRIFLLLIESWIGIYAGQYPIMGHARVMTAKVIWDTAVYWAVPGLLYFHDFFRRLAEHPMTVTNLARFATMSDHVQAFLLAWLAIAPAGESPTFVRYYDFDFMVNLQVGMLAGLSDEGLEAQFAANVDFLEQLGGQMVSVVMTTLSEHADADQAIGDQLARWQADEFLMGLLARYRQRDWAQPINSGWITLGAPVQERQEVAR